MIKFKKVWGHRKSGHGKDTNAMYSCVKTTNINNTTLLKKEKEINYNLPCHGVGIKENVQPLAEMIARIHQLRRLHFL